jgi:hypothetical protein
MAFVGLLWPQETGKIGSNPGFRHMHEVIKHDGIALRLDAWRTEARLQNDKCHTLDDLAASNPTEEFIHAIANYMATNYVAGGDVDMYSV